MIAAEAAQAAGITYRQVDYWVRAGYVQPSYAAGRSVADELTEAEVRALPEQWRPGLNPGSGSVRVFTVAEVEVMRRIAQLLRIGFRLDVAARLGRQLAEHPTLSVYAGEDVVLRLSEPHAQAEDYSRAYRDVHGQREAAELAPQLLAARAAAGPC